MRRKDSSRAPFVWHCVLPVILCIVCLSCTAWADTFVWQDFEYWDSPRNHGWICSSPSYPVWGFAGYGTLRTAIDARLQSRVLVLESMPSAFNNFFRFRTLNAAVPDPNPSTQGFDKNIISFNIINRFGIEQFDQWEAQIQVETRNGKNVLLVYRPCGASESGPEVGGYAEYGYRGGLNGGDPERSDRPLVVIYDIGRQYQDGAWHLVVRDLDEDIRKIGMWQGIDFSLDGFGQELYYGPEQSAIVSIMFAGFTMRVDNIAFHDRMRDIVNHPPKLQRIGPQFAQIFVPFSYLISVYERSDISGFVDERYEFVATIGGYGSRGVQTSEMIFRVKEDPNNPGYYLACEPDDPACLPDKVLLEFVPQTFEDLIITIRVTDPGGLSDMETFPLSVVNYPVVNHPPYLEEIENDVYLLGTNEGYFEKAFICYDQDMEDHPGSATEPGNITYRAIIDTAPNYQFGPWQEPLISEPFTPVIRFSPRFEGLHRISVIATDSRGLSAITSFALHVVNPGTWLNHPPILGEDIDSPQIVRVGETFTIPVEFLDPDNEEIYYSSNIGSITKMEEGFGKTPESGIGVTEGEDRYGRYVSGAIFHFVSPFPGTYHVIITAYDLRGGYCTAEFILDVQPWWAL